MEGWVVSPARSHKNVSNNDSVVLFLVRKGSPKVLALFTGDLMKQGEKKLLKLIRSEGYRVRGTLYKAGHHGSKTSSTAQLIKFIRPEVVLVTAGRHNQYGFPHAEVLQKFRRRAAAIFRVDALGNFELKFDF